MSTNNHTERSLGYNLKLAQHRLHRRMEEALKPTGLSLAQYAVLSALKIQPDQTNADLANAAFITPQSMQSVLSKLEKIGHVIRKQDEKHGRRQLARLTSSGEDLVIKGKCAVTQVEEDFVRSVHPLSLSDVLDFFHRLQQAMK